jgi:hypothetical protein
MPSAATTIVERYRKSSYFALDWLPYQVALGVSLRWFEGGPHLRIYIGPLKIIGAVFRPTPEPPDA